MDGTVKIWAVDDGVLMKNISVGGVHIYGLKGKRLNSSKILRVVQTQATLFLTSMSERSGSESRSMNLDEVIFNRF